MAKNKRKISIPVSAFKQIKTLAEKEKVGSVEEYIVKMLEEKILEGQDKSHDFNKEDEEKVKDRLKALGYMD